MDSSKLKDKTALVTGAGRGIGRAISVGFAAEGARIAVTARSTDELESLVKEIESSGGTAVAISADLSNRSLHKKVVQKAEESIGSLDILVNNAGIGSSSNPQPFCNFDDAFWDQSLELNLTTPYLLSKTVLPSLLKKIEVE